MTNFNLFDYLSPINSQYPYFNVYYTSDTQLVVEVALAGYSKEELSITIEGNQVTLQGVKQVVARTYLHKGISTKKFTKRFYLPKGGELVNTVFKDGILTLSIEIKVDKAMPTKVEIK